MLAGAFTLSLAAGAAAAPEASTTAPPGRIRVAYSSTADMGDLPSLMAHGLLAEAGYEVRATFFARAQLAAEAVARGGAEVALGSTRTYWAAVARGADLVTVMEQMGNGWSLLAAPEITGCRGLHGKRLAISSEGSVSAALVLAYVRTRCPGTEPRIVIIPGSEHRAAALLAGRVDAAPVELADSTRLELRAPGRVRTLVDFARELPDLKTTGIHVNRAWARRHPRAVEDYIRSVLRVHRAIAADPRPLIEESQRRLRIEPAVVRAHLRAGAWSGNGGLTIDEVASSLAFFAGAGALPPGLHADRVADLSYLGRVLAELGGH